MEPIYLISVGVAGVLLLLLAVIKFKIPAFIALLLSSLLVALAAGIPIQDIVTTVQAGMGGTLGSVALLVGLGAMLGRIIEVSGGAESLATRFTSILGPRRIVAALTAAAFLLAIPVFFDVGFIILVPIIYGFAKIIGANPVKVGLPIAGIMLTLHVVVPPHPGVVGAAGVLGADVGWVTLLAFAVCLPLGFVAYYVAHWINRRDFVMLPSTQKEFLAFGSRNDRAAGVATQEESAQSGSGHLTEQQTQAPPAPA
ncbi:SLC13 family permease [Acaricomes phytoseiuli]|uniref:GntT/GntP/DsdX family permease n=1 Tax=Acaricomes phytoseiuli TaxID=291968 RepID=UPI002223A677|nr:SLC13 family permease [Acaricomes phytoseiuli]MCW1248947.1 SLC13 family permease [Acaricomes phytoseiuli]